MNLDNIRKERLTWMDWKDIAPKRALLDMLPSVETSCDFSDCIKLSGILNENQKKQIFQTAWALRPWRKGPFEIFDTFIDSEWQSFIKYNLLEPHFDLRDKIIGDIGCNNGYYMFRFLNHKPKKLIGFDPSALCKTQFDFVNFYAKTSIQFELLGVEHLPFFEHKFDTLFCLGVLYHRHNPIETLKNLHKSLNENGELFLDTFYINSDDEVVLSPKKTYSKIANVHFIPSIKALENWLEKAGFSELKILACKKTDLIEQRKTDWILGQSLENFLDPNDENKTIEGYEAPKRVYIKAIK